MVGTGDAGRSDRRGIRHGSIHGHRHTEPNDGRCAYGHICSITDIAGRLYGRRSLYGDDDCQSASNDSRTGHEYLYDRRILIYPYRQYTCHYYLCVVNACDAGRSDRWRIRCGGPDEPDRYIG